VSGGTWRVGFWVLIWIWTLEKPSGIFRPYLSVLILGLNMLRMEGFRMPSLTGDFRVRFDCGEEVSFPLYFLALKGVLG
jgi:hypothetical protein